MVYGFAQAIDKATERIKLASKADSDKATTEGECLARYLNLCMRVLLKSRSC